jgi:nucleoside-diphosphate-sugar epimerase
VTGTRIVVELCRRFGVPSLVYTSTADVMMASSGSLVNATENSVLPPPKLKFMIHPYALTKFKAENIVLGADGLTLKDGAFLL